jgi:multicomponent K+:H+ antiporter subunit F
MIDAALAFAFTAFGLALLMNLWRLFGAENAIERILAVDTMVINVIALIILYGIDKGTGVYFEAALLLAMFGFVATVAYCKFLLRGDVIE